MKDESWGVALRTMVNVSVWIAFPIIVGLYLGKWLDNRFETSPWLFLTTMAVSFFISIYGLTVHALREFKRIDRKQHSSEKKIVTKSTNSQQNTNREDKNID